MTRGLVPPDTLSEDDVRTLRVVRRDMYTNGAIGGGIGACAGFVMYTGAQWAKKLGYIKNTTLNRNHGMLMTLSSFALGTFLASSKTGIEEVHVLHPIFRAGAVDVDAAETYEGRRQALMDNRMTRRKTLDNLLTKHHGLSDSHAGRWVEDEETAAKRGMVDNRRARRKTLDNIIRKGHGLNDSHAGRWVDSHDEDTTKFTKE